MKNEVKVFDKEPENIKDKLKGVGIMVVILVLIYPLEMGFLPNFLTVIFGFVAVTYLNFKYQEKKPK